MLKRPLAALLALVVLGAYGVAAAQAPARQLQVEIAQMTWLQVRDAVAAGTTTILIPTGGTEQNGPHMVLGKHNFIVAETSRRIASELGDALVAPVQPYVPEGDVAHPAGNIAYPGTVTVPEPVFASLLTAIADSFRLHGFKTIVFVGEHGQSMGAQAHVARELSKAWASQGVRVINSDAYYSANGGDLFLLRDHETEASIGDHAGIRDTSELMAVYPQGVDLANARINSDGATGDASRATPTRGQKLVAMKVEAAVREIKVRRVAPIEVQASTPTLMAWLGRWLAR